MRPRAAASLVAVSSLIALSCRQGPTLRVANHSGVVVSNIVVSGVGFTHAIPALQPGADILLPLRPASDSHVRITFDAGLHQDSGNLGYLGPSPAFHVGLVLGTNGTVTFVDSAR